MKKVFKIEVDCANCANKMEAALSKLKGLDSASISFMTQKMTLEFTEGADMKTVLKDVIKVCRKVDSDFEILA